MDNMEKVIKGLELLAHWPDGLIITDKEKWIKPLCETAVAMLKEQERKKGNWDYGTQCSACKGTIIPPKDRKVRVNFCPWCGADMRDLCEQEGR